MRQILRYSSVSVDTQTKTIAYSDLPTEDESQALPSFSNVPFVRAFSNSDRTVTVTARTTSNFTVEVGAEGDDDLPITIDVEIINRDSTSVTGPTPTTDFTSIVKEPLCTPMDIVLKHKRFTPNVKPFGELLYYCQQTRDIIDILSKRYGESGLKETTSWASPVVPAPLWRDDLSEFDNPEQSDTADAVNRVGVRGVQVADSVYTDMYTIRFTSGTEFSIEALIQGNQGSGNTSQDFTSGNGDVVIDSDAWFGTFKEGHEFYFAVYPWYHQVVKVAVNIATGEAMLDEYGEDQADEMKTAARFLLRGQRALAMLLKPDARDGMRLPSLSTRDFRPFVIPYEVDIFGRDLTKVETDNKDRSGDRGEGFPLTGSEEWELW